MTARETVNPPETGRFYRGSDRRRLPQGTWKRGRAHVPPLHVSCAERTPDGRFLLVADLGIDQVKIYRFDGEKGTLSLVDAIRCDLESASETFHVQQGWKILVFDV